MDRNEKIKVISQAIYDDYIEKGWKNVSIYDCEVKALHYVDTEIIVKNLSLSGVGNPLKCDFCGADEIYPNLDIRLYQCKCGATKSF